MSRDELVLRMREIAAQAIPLPASGQTARRHDRLMEIGREDLSLARLAEAHFDAVAILAEAGRLALPGALYGVWAAEGPNKTLALAERNGTLYVSGTKMFCSGAGIVDRALVTVAAPNPLLLDLDLLSHPESVETDGFAWKSLAFAHTHTATVTFHDFPVSRESVLMDRGWYLSRPGFWHGACGPAACWAGGASGLVDYALRQTRSDAHTLAHLGAMQSMVWQMKNSLEAAGREIDESPHDAVAAHLRALMLRHVIEQASTDILRRFARAYGPAPLAFDDQISRRYLELDIYLRQCHAERDLEALGKAIIAS